MTSQAKREPLPPEIRDFLIELAHGYRHLPEVHFSPLQSGTWDNISLASYSGELSVTGSALRLLIDASDSAFAELYDMMSIRNQPAMLTLQDGARVHAGLAHMQRLDKHAHISLHEWTWTTEVMPFAWIGRVEGKLPSLGNLTLAERGAGWFVSKADGFCFSGRYTWYILQQTEYTPALAVIDSSGTSLDREALKGDLFALELTLGGSIGLDYLVGCDATHNAVGAISVGIFERRQSGYRPPVPHHFNHAQVWLPEFFRHLASKIATEGLEPLIIAISAYLDAQTDHLDGAYLKAHVGLEAFARRLVGGPASDPPVNEEAGSAYSEEIVEATFHSKGITLPGEVRDELRKRKYAVHGYLMNTTVEYDIDRDVRRREMIQTLIVALVAIHIGYKGPIYGYDIADDGGRMVPPWWPVLTEDLFVRYWGERHRNEPQPPERRPPHEFAILIKVAAANSEHFRELRERALRVLAPNILSLDSVDLEYAASARDTDFMALAVEQARLSTPEPGHVRPRVGVVVVARGEIIARAHRGELGVGEHAEYTALERKLKNVDLSGATVFTTLEPCTVRNPPKQACVDWLIDRKISRVVVGTLDPNPRIKGEGVLRLREAGIPVQLTTPSLTTEIEQLNRDFSQEHRR